MKTSLPPSPPAAPARFVLSQYSQDARNNPLRFPGGFRSIGEAGEWANQQGLTLSTLRVTEYEVDAPADSYGSYERVGACNLAEAVEARYTDLNF